MNQLLLARLWNGDSLVLCRLSRLLGVQKYKGHTMPARQHSRTFQPLPPDNPKLWRGRYGGIQTFLLALQEL